MLEVRGCGGCNPREIPTNKTIKALLIRIACCEFLSKPLAVVTLMNNGIPSAHKAWWQSKSVDDFYRVYVALTATPTKVLEMLHVDTANQNEERVLTYLQQFIGSMKQDMIRRFYVSPQEVQCACPKASKLLLMG